MKTTLHHREASVTVEELPGERKNIWVRLINPSLFMPISSCQTSYPVELIEKILSVKGPAYLCDEILRDESTCYVQNNLTYGLLSYVDEEKFSQKRVLDFGCGSGASTLILARMFPHSDIVGLELAERLLEIARLRASYYACKNIEFIRAASKDCFPQHIGYFDYIVLSAVYEHLLPTERKVLLPWIWKALKPGGVLFLNQTPHRYSPIEDHTTFLPFINYLPDKAAFFYARYFSRRKLQKASWEELLRKGIRGGTVQEILRNLAPGSGSPAPTLLNPSRFGLQDRIDLWYMQTEKDKHRAIKMMVLTAAKLLKFLTGITLVPSLSLAILKN